MNLRLLFLGSVIAISFLSSSAYCSVTKAQKSSTKAFQEQGYVVQSSVTESNGRKKLDLRGFEFYGYISGADEVNTTVSAKGSKQGAVFSTDTAFGVGVKYSKLSHQNFGFYFSGGYEFSREFNSLRSDKETAILKTKPKLTMFIASAGGQLLLSDAVFLSGGLNYNIPALASAPNGLSFEGKIGYEGGAGVKMNKHFSAQLLYRTLNFSGSTYTAKLEDTSLSGIHLVGSYVY